MAKKKSSGGRSAGKKNNPAAAEAQNAANAAAGAAKGAKAEKPKQKQGKASGGESQSIGAKISQFREFFEESKVELKKVTWPTRKETIATSTAVLILVFVMSLFLGLVDLGLAKIIEAILR
jgi:preprotein translocase subunit SecE